MAKLKRRQRIRNALRRWVDYDRLSGHATGLKAVLAKLLVPQSPQYHESFDNAVERLKLKPLDIQIRMHSLKRLVIIMLVIATVIFMYAVYNLIHAYWISSILSFILFILTLVLAFRYHFWYFQLQQKKLGTTFLQWFKVGLLKQNYKKDLEIK